MLIDLVSCLKCDIQVIRLIRHDMACAGDEKNHSVDLFLSESRRGTCRNKPSPTRRAKADGPNIQDTDLPWSLVRDVAHNNVIIGSCEPLSSFALEKLPSEAGGVIRHHVWRGAGRSL